MSVRLEWIEATNPYVRPAVFLKGETLADGNRITSPMALGLGPLIIEGTPDQLRSILAHAGDAIDSEEIA